MDALNDAASTEGLGLRPLALPRTLSSFVGRRAELEELTDRLESCRLLTMSGGGGCGKTRLALEVVAASAGARSGGTAFVDLAPLRDAAAVAERVATSLGLAPRGGDNLARLIGTGRVLLLLDSCEHLIDAVAPLIDGLLASCPNLRILTTSRESLGIAGERVWDVPNLRLPPAERADDPYAISEYDAVRLFVERAQERDSDFRLHADNAALVTAVCRRLDGIPLALELAAARVRSIGLTEVAARLDDVFRLLPGATRTAVERHRTLRAAIDWSEQLLEPRERILLRRLGVLVGTFDLEAVETVCSAADLPARDVIGTLDRLVDKSLVVVQRRPDGSVRYRLLEVIRQYARGQLLAAGETDVADRHARHYARVVRRQLAGRTAESAFKVLRDEYDNVRIAMDWAVAANTDLLVELVNDLRAFWTYYGMVREARTRLLTVAGKDSLPPAVRARRYLGAATWSRLAGDLEGADELLDAATRLCTPLEDRQLQCWLLNARGLNLVDRGDPIGAIRDLRRALELARDQLPRDDLEMSLNNLAVACLLAGDSAEALEHSQSAVGLLKPGDAVGLRYRYHDSAVLHTYGSVLMALGRVDEAWAQFTRGLESAVERHNDQAAVVPLLGLACAASIRAMPEACLRFLGAAQRCATASGVVTLRSQCTPHEDAERSCRTLLGRAAAERAWLSGRRMELPTVIEFAREAAGVHDETMPPAPAAKIPRRKVEVVRLVAEGLSSKEIGARLLISERTVEAHMDQLRTRYGLRNRAQIVAWAAFSGLLEARPDPDLDHV